MGISALVARIEPVFGGVGMDLGMGSGIVRQ